MDFIDRLNYYHKWKWKYMKTTLLTPETDENAIKTAAELIRQGEVVGMPTETVYGLAANALNGEAVKKIFLAKGRPQDNPLIVHIADFDQIYDLCPSVPPQAKQLAEAFWPGPMTMIVPKGGCIPDEVSCGLDTVGIRLPSHPMARALIRESGVPLAAPSANTSGRPSTTTAAHVMRDMDGKIAAVLGEVDVDRALYEKIGDDVKVSAPGMKYRHYAPKAPVTVVRGDPAQTAAYIAQHIGEKTGVMCFDEYRDCFPGCVVECFGSENDLGTQAREVFDRLRAFDDTDVRQIWAQCPSDEGLGLAVANRIKKAAGFSVVEI